ncbi:MAG: hypothetical protein ICV68_00595, partial [Pyrinomonadaceae bacterium]|nr:hypothetical protein [Pyrinomonadaceae bacterium]
MSRLLLILIIMLASYSTNALAQTTPAEGQSNQATTAATPSSPSTSVAQPVNKKDEDCGCEAQALPEVLAVVNGVRITSKDVNGQVGERVSALQRQVVEARKREVDLQINSKLLEAEAKKRKVSTIKLLEEEVIGRVK